MKLVALSAADAHGMDVVSPVGVGQGFIIMTGKTHGRLLLGRQRAVDAKLVEGSPFFGVVALFAVAVLADDG